VVVRLTWSGQEEPDPRLPAFELLLEDELVEKCISPKRSTKQDKFGEPGAAPNPDQRFPFDDF